MSIDGGSGLGTEVAVPGVEIECTDAVFAAGAPELHAALDGISGVVSHGLIVVLCSEGRAHGGLSKVIFGRPRLCKHDRTWAHFGLLRQAALCRPHISLGGITHPHCASTIKNWHLPLGPGCRSVVTAKLIRPADLAISK